MYPIYHLPQIQRVIANAVRWAAPRGTAANVPQHIPFHQAPEKLTPKGPALHDADGNFIAG